MLNQIWCRIWLPGCSAQKIAGEMKHPLCVSVVTAEGLLRISEVVLMTRPTIPRCCDWRKEQLLKVCIGMGMAPTVSVCRQPT